MGQRIREDGGERVFLSVLLYLFAASLFFFDVEGATSGYGIQRISVNKPDIAVYYRAEAADGNLEAYLAGEKLSLKSDQVFSETGESIEYYLMVDISGSIQNFDSIKSALARFLNQIRSEDRFVLITFGDQVTRILTGEESRSEAVDRIEDLVAADHTTMLADAVKQTVDMMDESAGPQKKQQVLVIISDGKPDKDNNASVDNAQAALISNGIEAYTIAVDNSEGDTKEQINNYRSRFNDLANNTGGLPWSIDSDNTELSVLDGLTRISADILEGHKALFLAATNRVSHQTEEFVLKFQTPGRQDTRNILIENHKKDTNPPEIKTFEYEPGSGFLIEYSEPVLRGDLIDSYQLSCDDKPKVISRVHQQSSSKYTLLLGENVQNGSYHITVTNVTDDSEEENPLEDNEADVEITDIAPEYAQIRKNDDSTGFLIEYSMDVTGANEAENYSIRYDGKTVGIRKIDVVEGRNGRSYNIVIREPIHNGSYEISSSNIKDARTGKNTLSGGIQLIGISGVEEPTFAQKMIRMTATWWPVVLTILIFVILLFLGRFFKRVRDNRVTIVGNQVLEYENLEQKFHVGMDRIPDGKMVTIWLSSGSGEATRIQKRIDGSLCVGRSPRECDVYCDDPMMSKQHFILSTEKDGGVYVTDLESTNGTIVNGVRIHEKHRLQIGDEVLAGNIRFHIEWQDGE